MVSGSWVMLDAKIEPRLNAITSKYPHARRYQFGSRKRKNSQR
jgi:hypothetical protein